MTTTLDTDRSTFLAALSDEQLAVLYPILCRVSLAPTESPFRATFQMRTMVEHVVLRKLSEDLRNLNDAFTSGDAARPLTVTENVILTILEAGQSNTVGPISMPDDGWDELEAIVNDMADGYRELVNSLR